MLMKVILVLMVVVVVCWALGLTLRGWRRLPGTRRHARQRVGPR